MPDWFRKAIARIPRWESRIAFADWLWRGLYFGATIAMGWWTAAQAWAEGVIVPYGTLGYVSVVLCVALLITLVLMGVAWAVGRWRDPSLARIEVQDLNVTEPADPDPIDEQAHHDLTLFVTDYVLPLTWAHINLQSAIVKARCPYDQIVEMASQSIMFTSKTRQFGENFEHFRNVLCESPTGTTPFGELKHRILAMDKGYEGLCSQTFRAGQFGRPGRSYY